MEPIRGTGEFSSLPDEADEVHAPEHEGKQAKPGPFSYLQQSPVVEVMPGDELGKIANSLIRNIEAYGSTLGGEEVYAPPQSSTGHAPRSEDATKWRERIGNSIETADMIKGHEANIHSYDLGGGHSAGLLSLSHADSETEVLQIVTHPGGSGAGNTLMEKAVNESHKAGNHGIVHLNAENLESIALYEKQGFKAVEEREGHYILDPSKSEHWHQQDGQWGMKHNEGKGYLASPETLRASQKQQNKRSADDEDHEETPYPKRQRLT